MDDSARRARPAHPWAAALLVLLAVAALVLGTAAPASAHASLVGSDPAEGAVLPAQPEQVRLSFSESVALVPDGVRVFDAEGEPVASTATVAGAELAVALGEQVGTGTLVLVWRVVSEDGHPVSGSLTFSVGAPSAQVAAVPGGEVATEPPWTLSVVGWIGYGALLATGGLVAFAVLFLPATHLADRSRRRLVRAARGGAVAAVAAWLLGLPLAATYQLGGGIGSLAQGATWAALPAGQYAVPAAVVVGVVVAVVRLGRGAGGRLGTVVTLAAGTLAVSAPALTGHTRAATPEALAVGADMLHLVAGSVWLGGLVALVLVLPDLAGRGAVAAETLARFSAVAAGVLVVLVGTGALLAWRILGSWGALVETGYGRLLLAKIATAVIAVLIAAGNRFLLVPRLREATRRRDRRDGADLLARSTTIEALVLAVVLLVTGLLVDRSPEPDRADVASPAASVVREAPLGDLRVRATLAPPQPGPSAVTVELLDADGEPTEGLAAPEVRLGSATVDLGAIPVGSVAPGTYAARVVLPTAGEWRLQVSLRVTEFENPVAVLAFEVAVT